MRAGNPSASTAPAAEWKDRRDRYVARRTGWLSDGEPWFRGPGGKRTRIENATKGIESRERGRPADLSREGWLLTIIAPWTRHVRGIADVLSNYKRAHLRQDQRRTDELLSQASCLPFLLTDEVEPLVELATKSRGGRRGKTDLDLLPIGQAVVLVEAAIAERTYPRRRYLGLDDSGAAKPEPLPADDGRHVWRRLVDDDPYTAFCIEHPGVGRLDRSTAPPEAPSTDLSELDLESAFLLSAREDRTILLDEAASDQGHYVGQVDGRYRLFHEDGQEAARYGPRVVWSREAGERKPCLFCGRGDHVEPDPYCPHTFDVQYGIEHGLRLLADGRIDYGYNPDSDYIFPRNPDDWTPAKQQALEMLLRALSEKDPAEIDRIRADARRLIDGSPSD